jgi:dipeptidyl aminopeptidase/acylaminoacyl peptidase
MLRAPNGDPAFAQVVLPLAYQPGRRYPLVVTTYRSRGFLRGNVGEEYPIYPLSAAGFVVLSVDRPELYALSRRGSWEDLSRAWSRDLAGRENVLQAVNQAIQTLDAEGLVDRRKIAITGLSAGAEFVHYALQRTDEFAVAIASSGAQDLTFFALVPNREFRASLMDYFGSKSIIPSDGNVIRELAWSLQPERLRTPLLINVGEHEAMIGFEGVAALQQANRPIEVRVFPDEAHFKYHPASIAGVYDNNMMWLKFWLNDEEDRRPEFAAQYQRWRAMRTHLQAQTKVESIPQ